MTRIAESEAGVAGVDEAGRGPLAGPVVAAAVVLDGQHPIPGLADSKRLSPARRDWLAGEIRAHAAAWAVCHAPPAVIDRDNILQASLQAMADAIVRLATPPRAVRVDGSHCPHCPYPTIAVVGGDRSETAIAAASILAKVERDQYMVAQAALYPGYGFERHKGYGTREHRAALQTLGPCPLHRHSFAPVRAAAGAVSNDDNRS